MVNSDLLLLILFGVLLLILMIVKRKKLHFEKLLFPLFYLVLYKTKLGITKMDWLSKKHPRIVKILGKVGILAGFSGMIMVFYLLIKSAMLIFSDPSAPGGVQPLFPGMCIEGLPCLGFWHWIITIFILAIVHEFSHGVVARAYDIKIKSSGFAIFGLILPILPAAFVEPDEKQLQKKSKIAQLSVFAAGSFSNFLVAIIFGLLFFLVFLPVTNNLIQTEGVVITDVQEELPAAQIGIEGGEAVRFINDNEIKSVNEFLIAFNEIDPGDTISIVTNVSSYSMIAAVHPQDDTRGYIGVYIDHETSSVPTDWWFPVFLWTRLLVYWVAIINFFVGLFNLFPIVILDGGRMFYVLVLGLTKDETMTKKIYKVVNLIAIALLLINFWPFLSNLFLKLVNLF
jgi:membrane-associated protease RseP (regulator of RpoE activity)